MATCNKHWSVKCQDIATQMGKSDITKSGHALHGSVVSRHCYTDGNGGITLSGHALKVKKKKAVILGTTYQDPYFTCNSS